MGLRDVSYMVAGAFAFVITALFCYVLVVNFHNADIIKQNALADASMTVTETAFTSYYDTGFLIAFVVSIVAIMILGHQIPTHPVFFVPFVIGLVFIVIFCNFMGQLYNSIATNPNMVAYASSFVYIPYVMSNLSLLTFVLTLLVGIVIYTGIPNRS